MKLEDGRKLNIELYIQIFDDEIEKMILQFGEENLRKSKFNLAKEIFDKLVLSEKFEEFLTLSAYQYI